MRHFLLGDWKVIASIVVLRELLCVFDGIVVECRVDDNSVSEGSTVVVPIFVLCEELVTLEEWLITRWVEAVLDPANLTVVECSVVVYGSSLPLNNGIFDNSVEDDMAVEDSAVVVLAFVPCVD